MQSLWPDPPCGSRPEVLTRAGLLVVQPETLRYSGSSVFSWFFWIGKLAVRTTRRRDVWRVQRKDTQWVSRRRKATWGPDRQQRSFQLCNWHCIARYAVREE